MGAEYDSFVCDWYEWCECDITDKFGCIIGCSYPLFIRHIIAIKEKIKEKVYDMKAQRAFDKEEKERYEFGMNEEEYFSYKINKR